MKSPFASWLIGIPVVVLAACNPAVSQPDRKAISQSASSDQKNVSALLKRLGIRIPPSATLEYANYVTGMDDNARLILVMPAADWAVMQARPPLNATPPERYIRENAGYMGSDTKDWRPGAEPELKAVQILLPEAEGLNVGVAPAGDGRVRVYIYWIET